MPLDDQDDELIQCDCCGQFKEDVSFCVTSCGLDTFACPACRGIE
jgi:hypothetical protein